MHIFFARSFIPRVTTLFSLALCLAAALLLPVSAHAQGYTLTTLHTFSAADNSGNNSDGTGPRARVTLDGMGHLYSTTYSGGPFGYGTLFEYDLSTKTFKTLVKFTGRNGAHPKASVTLDGQNHLYGTTINGGYSGYGTLFQYDLSKGIRTTLITFHSGSGANPSAGVTLDGQGHLYGTTYDGALKNSGMLFQYDFSTHVRTTLVIFKVTNGSASVANVTLDGQGHLYGTTAGGGQFGYGTVFEYDLATQAFTTLANFNNLDEGDPETAVTLDGMGNLYGTTRNTVFEINIATHSLTTLVTFNGTNGSLAFGSVTLDGQGSLYGTTLEGGSAGGGTVYKVNLATHELTTLFNFDNAAGPDEGITLDGNGNLYGTTSAGGANNSGTVFELTPNS